MLITSPEFTSNLTGKTYYTKSFDPLDCSTKNVIDVIECTLTSIVNITILVIPVSRPAASYYPMIIQNPVFGSLASYRCWLILLRNA
jgi:hypothetical protein